MRLPSIVVTLLFLTSVGGGLQSLPLFPAAWAATTSEQNIRWKRAISNDRVDVLREILQAASDKQSQIAVRAETGKNALMIACKTGDLDFVIELLTLGADPKSTTRTGGTPLMFSVLGNHLPVAKHLVGLDVDVNAQGSNGWSAMTIAAAKGYTKVAAYLVDKGADINVLDVYRWTPLMRAVDNGQRDVARLLVGLDSIALDNQDEGGNTALHHAVAGEDTALLSLLLEAGADRNIVNFQQQLARQLAVTLPSAASLLPLLDSD